MDDFIWGFIIGAFVLGFGAASYTETQWEQGTVDRGLAQYCPLDARWAWKGECGDE